MIQSPIVSIRARHACRAMRSTRASNTRRQRSFNPRPARVPGDAAAIVRARPVIAVFQSAPGTRAGRCRAHFSFLNSLGSFNPRPARVPGDARRGAEAESGADGFNPRPARVPGDACYVQPYEHGHGEFQSAPGTRAGRCASTSCFLACTSWFQSAPGTRAGRCRGVQPQRAVVDAVSIRARHACRAMPALENLYRGGDRFNPRPARVPGDAEFDLIGHFLFERFNPRPARVPGDAPASPRRSAAPTCFNPRPARVPGDARARLRLRGRGRVSIRARHACRAMLDLQRRGQIVFGFQSAPGTRAGRCRIVPAKVERATLGFNPRPARVPGDAPPPPRPNPLRTSFNPRPARVPGDAPALPIFRTARMGFNPRPARVPGDAITFC